MINWKEEYRIGIKLIDEQHKKLFELANKAFDLLKDDFYIDKYDDIIMILKELKNYAIYHFKSEEDYMESIKYRKILSHKVEHDDFIQKIEEVDIDKIDENQDKYILDLLEFIVNWIDKHILGTDKLITADL
ncbi:MAG TPA: hemerythrin family protein [Thermoanaerobacterales bacterium]|nr:hemerythrin family protein [Thermoanaerobacterales bacterium]